MKKGKSGTVRIIAGQWRGSRLPVPELPGLRPSGDRGRETLFSWLQTDIRGSRCADLFAGSGALGLEAASRGAARVTLIEKSAQAVEGLRKNLARLGAEQVDLVRGDAIAWLQDCPAESLDIVFVDPPFGSGLETRVMQLLQEGKCMAKGGWVYIETARESVLPALGSGWEIHREKMLGDVRMLLLKKI